MNQAIAEFCVRAYDFLFPIAFIGVAIVALVLLPMAIFRTTRRAAGFGMLFSTYLIGITTWFLAAAVTFGTWGWKGLIIGLCLAGVGVLPVGILAAFISLKSPSLGFSLIAMVIITWAINLGGIKLSESGTEA